MSMTIPSNPPLVNRLAEVASCSIVSGWPGKDFQVLTVPSNKGYRQYVFDRGFLDSVFNKNFDEIKIGCIWRTTFQGDTTYTALELSTRRPESNRTDLETFYKVKLSKIKGAYCPHSDCITKLFPRACQGLAAPAIFLEQEGTDFLVQLDCEYIPKKAVDQAKKWLDETFPLLEEESQGCCACSVM